ncbi:lipoprotein signal peptidase [Gammaproteobacteria bacterium]
MLKIVPSLRWLWVSVVIVLIDQATKFAITAKMTLHQIIEILPVLNITLTYNPGAAFSFLADASGWQRWFFSGLTIIVSGVLVSWLHRLQSEDRLQAIGLVMVLGGALGNLWDRLWLGHVVDFIQVHWQNAYFPAFNIADSAITLGAACIILNTMFFEQKI